MLDLQDIFGPAGPLEAALQDFTVREPQWRMAERVAAAIARREALVIEAGTGTGKTFAYLVPALLSGARVLISTGTRTLQDQLYAKDLPLVARALGRPATVALLKGRSNYLCRYRLGPGESALPLPLAGEDAAADSPLERIRRWALTTRSGDLAEVGGLADSDPVWGEVTSTRDNCLGVRCPELSRCHVALARRAAIEADVVIVNHHLLLADLALKEDGFGDLLGAADAVILDEAHQIADLATQFFGAEVGSRRIETLLAELEGRVRQGGAPARALLETTGAVRACLAQMGQALEGRGGRLEWEEAEPLLGADLARLRARLGELTERLRGGEPDAPLASFAERCAELAASLERIASLDSLEGARCVQPLRRGFTLSLMPFDIAPRFQGLVRARPCAWIFTSATLSLGEDFGHFTSRLGLTEADTLRIDSPFDFARQSLLYLPESLPAPHSPEHLAAVMRVARTLIEAADGGAFVLFTSHRSLARAAALWRAAGAPLARWHLLVQGEAPRERLLQTFRADGNAVLFGTASFWEGVDVKGDALRLVVIEKLPFASPEDPLVRARIAHLESTGASAFRDYQLPEAALALKQGVGRLIRSEQDFGVVAICDPRLGTRGYGKVLLAALPPMTRTHRQADAIEFLSRRVGTALPREAVP
ncbi:MAG: ATP-dependent DNA helicase [Steroidobacteraceae bacterium]